MFEKFVEELATLLKKNQTDKAVAKLLEALDSPVQSNRSSLWALLSNVYLVQGKMDEAEKALKSGLVEFPDDLKLKLDLLNLYSSSDKASQQYEILLKELSSQDLPAWERAFLKKIQKS